MPDWSRTQILTPAQWASFPTWPNDPKGKTRLGAIGESWVGEQLSCLVTRSWRTGDKGIDLITRNNWTLQVKSVSRPGFELLVPRPQEAADRSNVIVDVVVCEEWGFVQFRGWIGAKAFLRHSAPFPKKPDTPWLHHLPLGSETPGYCTDRQALLTLMSRYPHPPLRHGYFKEDPSLLAPWDALQ
jgi:hypothetical protein